MEKPLAVDKDEFRLTLNRLAPWTYHVASGAIDSRHCGTYSEETVNFHCFRRGLISETAAGLLGEKVNSATVLDLACHCGVFTLDFADSGFAYCKGIDLREKNIEQANFLKNAFALQNCEFEVGNIKNLTWEKYDVVLLLGIMYHLSTPFEILKQAFQSTKKFCIVDTITHKEPVPAYFLQAKDSGNSLEGDEPFELQPTYRGIIESMRLAGFSTIVEIISDTPSTVELYCDSTRRCLMGITDQALAASVLEVCI